MVEGLKPCPFCGGEAQTTLRNVGDCGEDSWSVECFDPECGCDFCLYHTEAEAVAAWNTRAERTCEMRESSQYVECKVQTFTCSACGWYGAIDNLFTSDTIPNYCPNCGARVVEGEGE